MGEARNQHQRRQRRHEGRRRLEGGRSRGPQAASARRPSAPGSICCNALNDRFIGSHAGAPADRLQDGLRSGRAADAEQGGQGLRPGRRAGRGARRLRPQSLWPGLPAGAAAGRARRAVRRSDAGRQRRHRLGHAPEQFRGGQGAQRHARPGLGHADERPQGARPAGLDR